MANPQTGITADRDRLLEPLDQIDRQREVVGVELSEVRFIRAAARGENHLRLVHRVDSAQEGTLTIDPSGNSDSRFMPAACSTVQYGSSKQRSFADAGKDLLAWIATGPRCSVDKSRGSSRFAAIACSVAFG